MTDIDRRTLLKGMAAVGAVLPARYAPAQSAAEVPDSIGPSPDYLRIATEEAWTTAAIADGYRDYIATNPLDEPGFLALGSRYYARGASSPLLADMLDLGERRIADMDRYGIDRQLLLLTAPGVQVFDADTGTGLAADSNDQLAAAIARHPDRFSGLAAVAPQDPARAAREIERAMTTLGLSGVVINSHTKGEFLDEQKFWDILEAAEAHDAPLYIHPRNPAPSMLDPYLKRGLEAGILGFSADVALHTIALITAGVFDRFPRLQLVIGHAGEGIPYMLYRIDYLQRAVREGRGALELERRPSEYFTHNIHITTSGMAWAPAISFAQSVLGVDRVMYAMDYPYQADAAEVVAMDSMDMPAADKKKFFQTNAERLFRLG